MSFKYITNSKWSKTEPCRATLNTGVNIDVIPCITTLRFLTTYLSNLIFDLLDHGY